jgi:hypothetical protein
VPSARLLRHRAPLLLEPLLQARLHRLALQHHRDPRLDVPLEPLLELLRLHAALSVR